MGVTNSSIVLLCTGPRVSQVRQLMEKMDMDHDGNVGGDEFLATLIDWGQVRFVKHSTGQ
jgi:hypothetical protein